MKLWIDNMHIAPKGYKKVNVHEAKIYCCQHLNSNKNLCIEEINLNHSSIELLSWIRKKTTIK